MGVLHGVGAPADCNEVFWGILYPSPIAVVRESGGSDWCFLVLIPRPSNTRLARRNVVTRILAETRDAQSRTSYILGSRTTLPQLVL